MKYFVFLLCMSVVLLYSCTKDRTLQPVNFGNDSVNLKINEYAAASPTLANEFGVLSDWVEIYNAGDDTFKAEKHKTFITDNISDKGQYALPAFKIAPKGYLLIFCDGSDTVANEIHTNFKLSSGGEDLDLFALSGTDTVALDIRSFGLQEAGKSEGRSPDGSNNWQVFDIPTPGQPNN